MDVVVPHTRTMADMLEVLDVLVHADHDTRGDFLALPALGVVAVGRAG